MAGDPTKDAALGSIIESTPRHDRDGIAECRRTSRKTKHFVPAPSQPTPKGSTSQGQEFLKTVPRDLGIALALGRMDQRQILAKFYQLRREVGLAAGRIVFAGVWRFQYLCNGHPSQVAPVIVPFWPHEGALAHEPFDLVSVPGVPR